MKNLNHLTMADKSALNLLAKVTNKFESEGTILSELVNFASSVPFLISEGRIRGTFAIGSATC